MTIQVKHDLEIGTGGRFRPIWNFERKFIKAPAANVSVVARIRGSIDPGRLRDALLKLRKIHPLLASRIVEEDIDKAAYLHTDNVPEIPLRVIKRLSEDHWINILQEEHLFPFDYRRGPLVRFVLVLSPDSQGLSELIIFCQHTICDGTALANCLNDLLKHYADPGLPAVPIVPPRTIDRIMPPELNEKGLKAIVKHLFINNLNRRWRKNSFVFTYRDFLDVYRGYWQKKIYRFILLELPGKQTEELDKKCRGKGITINSTLTTAFLKAYQDVCGLFPKNNLVIPYDLRRRSDDLKNTFCFLVNSAEVPFSKIIKAEFWDAAVMLHNEIKEKINDRSLYSIINDIQKLDGSILDTLGILGSAAFMPPDSPGLKRVRDFLADDKNVANVFYKRFKEALPGAVMTNLGKLDYPGTYDDLTLVSMIFTPSASEDIPLQLGAAGAAGTLTLTVNYIDDREEPDLELAGNYKMICERALDYLGLSTGSVSLVR